ncbi:MAG TPA: hypothetical protein PLG17_01480 [Thermodesulfobacteriota bacterium]|nr:hypothetical protein [Deltaproteobacteria bacterium]HQO77162.1 hypothetical protein [Thermodesulfobacteriota bacterium]
MHHTRFLPHRFIVAIGGYPGPFYSLKLHGDNLQYEATQHASAEPQQEVLSIDEEKWMSFWTRLDKIGIWDWQLEYQNPGICDGTHWLVDIAISGRSITCRGYNNYPNSKGGPSGKPEPTPAFNQFLEAVCTLIEGRDFR